MNFLVIEFIDSSSGQSELAKGKSESSTVTKDFKGEEERGRVVRFSISDYPFFFVVGLFQLTEMMNG